MKRLNALAGKKVVRELLLAVATLVAAERAPGQWEGVVQSKNSTTDETGAPQQFMMTMSIKQDRIRVETSPVGTTPGTTMIYRADRHVVWMLNDEEKSYFEMLHEEKSQTSQVPLQTDPGAKPAIRKTGKTRKILGYAADQILVRRYDQETEIWGTKSLATLSETISRVLGQNDADTEWMDEVKVMGYFPLVAMTKVEGQVVESQEVTQIEPRALPSDLFELPAAYRKQDVGEGLDVPGPKTR